MIALSSHSQGQKVKHVLHERIILMHNLMYPRLYFVHVPHERYI